MKRFHICFFVAAVAVPSALGQSTDSSETLREQLETVRQQAEAVRMQAQAVVAQAGKMPAIGSGNFFDNGVFYDGYEGGMRALDRRKYDLAVQSFDKVVAAKSPRADGALYWKAYALNRLGKRDEALAAIAQLQRDYPKSRWLNDAQALQVEVRQNSGKPVSPEEESNEDLKLIAINGLLGANPDRAIPALEGILKGTAAPPVKDRALFVLAQSQSARAQQVVADYAKGAGNPDLQTLAVRYLGMEGTQERLNMLASIYSTTADTSVKRAIVQALFMGGAAGKLVDLAKKERDPKMKIEIVQQLSHMGDNKEAMDYLQELLK